MVKIFMNSEKAKKKINTKWLKGISYTENFPKPAPFNGQDSLTSVTACPILRKMSCGFQLSLPEK